MPRQGKRQGGATPSGAKTNESPTGRTAVGPQAFNLGKLRAKLLPKVGRAHNSSLNTISEAGRSVNALDRLQVHTQRMNQLQSSYVKGRERELNQKHNAGKKRFTPDTPDKVRYLHSKFRQVFQPFGKNREKYADRNQTKTQSVHGHKDSQQPKSL